MQPIKMFAAVLAAACLLSPFAAQAQPITVVEVSAPKVNCLFNASCKVNVTDTVGDFDWTPPTPKPPPPGTAWLQSRIYTGDPGTPADGLTAYVYRVSMAQATGSGCVNGLYVNFGPDVPLPYGSGKDADMFVITKGALGAIGVQSATRVGDVVVVQFAKPVCAGGKVASDANQSFFFGMASKAPPMKTVIDGQLGFVHATGLVPEHKIEE